MQEDKQYITSPIARAMKKMCFGPVIEHWPSVRDVLGSISARQKEVKEKMEREGKKRRKGEEKRTNNIKRDHQLSMVVHVANTST